MKKVRCHIAPIITALLRPLYPCALAASVLASTADAWAQAPANQVVTNNGRSKITDFVYEANQPPLRTAQAPPQPRLGQPGPNAPGPERVPQVQAPNLDAVPGFGPDQIRLPLMGDANRPIGTTPQPTPEKLEEYRQFVERSVEPEVTLDVVQHQPRLLIFKQSPIRVQIADETIADYVLITDREFSITGKQIGQTLLNFWFRDPQNAQQTKILSYLVKVFPDTEAKKRLEMVYKALEDEINRAFPNSSVQLTLVGDRLLVRGEAKDMVEAAQIMRIANTNAPGRSTTPPVQNLNVNVSNDAFGNPPPNLQDFLMQGQGDNATFGQNGPMVNNNPNVINLLRVSGEQQVMLRVSVAEVNRNAARSIGMNMNFYPNTANTQASVSGGSANVSNQFPYVFQSLSGNIGTGNLPALLDNGQIALAIQALRTLSLARSLAEPNLVTTNGQPARFHAGGSFPITTSLGNVTTVAQTVTYVPFGVSLFFTPYITDRDRVRLMIGAQVSTRSDATTTAGGTAVPTNLDSRTFTTTVELREGQTLAVAGLIQNNFGATSQRVPFFGDLPLIGTLAGLRSTTSAEQELVILITPELVHPLEACQGPPLPGADVFEPGDVEFYLCGQLESRRSYDNRSSVRTDFARMRAYERCEDRFIIGVQGRAYGCCDRQQMGPCPPPGLAPIRPGMIVEHGPDLSVPQATPVAPPQPTEAVPEKLPPPAASQLKLK
jgi:pilus assembly protein CpaC